MSYPQPSMHPQPTALRASLGLSQLREGLGQWYAALQAIEVEYESATRVLLGDPQGAEFAPHSLHHFAFKRDKRFKCSALGRKWLGLPETTAAFDGARHQTYRSSSRTASIESRKQAFIDQDGYSSELAIPLNDDDLAQRSQSDYYLPFACARDDLDWRVADPLEAVEGALCHVLASPAGQRIWIDPTIGYAMRFRESMRRQCGMSANGEPVPTRQAFYNYHLAGGNWMPWRVERVSPAATINCSNGVIVHVSYRVSRLAVNDDVHDHIFAISFPRGTLVNDHIRESVYRVGPSGREINLSGPEWYTSLCSRR